MKSRSLLILPLILFAALGCNEDEPTRPAPTDPNLPPELRIGTGEFTFRGSAGSVNRPVRVLYHRPLASNTESPIVFVMHGNGRGASGYRNSWIPLAERDTFILVVPEFSRDEYPSTRQYHQGNILNSSGAAIDSTEWTFTTIEAIFDEVVARARSSREKYHIYGHSAGGQFVHRMLWMMPGARIDNAVPANAGWYTLPDPDVRWPNGLAGTGSNVAIQERVRAAAARKVTLLLGEADTSTTDSDLLTTPFAMSQGKHRFERGHYFFDEVEEAATRNGVPLEWRLQTVPNVAHSNARMAPAAAEAIKW